MPAHSRWDNKKLSKGMSGLSAAYDLLMARHHDNRSHKSTAAGETTAEDGSIADGEAAGGDPGRYPTNARMCNHLNLRRSKNQEEQRR
mmetsp:Transcript_21243/g.38061  ORF Transcript_21243/g.38061 Transcript_21243/m.38061 type:complete len:88 (-) Transcript_21243:1419-1682(-)